MAGRLVEHVNRLIRSGLASIAEEPAGRSRTNAQALVVVRHRLGRLIVDRRNLTRELATPPPEAQALSEKAELAVRKGREDLARAALAEVARMTSDRQAITAEIAALDADIGLLEAAVTQLTGERPEASASSSASLQALLAELDRLEREPDDTRRRNQDS